MKGFAVDELNAIPGVSESRILYWTGAQMALQQTILNMLAECKATLNIREPNELHFKFTVYFFCDLLVPDDADCVLDVNKHPEFPEVPVFEIHVNMGLHRWREFKQGATLMIRQVFRAAMPDAGAVIQKGFNVTPFEDHVNVTGLDGVFQKTKNYK